MFSVIARVVANSVFLVGLFLLVRVLHKSVTGSLVTQFFAQLQGSWIRQLYALGLSLPVPFHVISVEAGSPAEMAFTPFARAVWVAVVVSGCWLGVALGIRVLILR